MKRGILIDVDKLNVREVQFDGLKDMYRLIGCDMVECLAYGKNLDVWVDEEGLLKNDGKGYFMLPSYPQPIKGNGLLTGGVDGDGETKSCTLTLQEAANLITFGVLL